MRIAVFGLGKLGAVMAAVLADAGHDVVGVDLSADLVALVNAGVAPVDEPGLQALMDASAGRLRATTDAADALDGAQASYVIVPTPSGADGTFTNRYVVTALDAIGSRLAAHADPHTVVICSTVMPGSCDGELRAALEQASGRQVGVDVGLVYSPEFIALGSIVRDMQHPDLVLIGESDAASGDIVEAVARSVVRNTPTVKRMTPVNAELTKIAINTFVTTKISFANMLGEICDQLDGADVDVVTDAVGSDSRIGTKYLKGAIGYGGPCFPRDNIALTRLADAVGVDAAIARATDAVNDRQVDRVAALVVDAAAAPAKVVVLGLSYKPDTPVCERSQGVELANVLAARGYDVTAVDPSAVPAGTAELSPAVRTHTHAATAIDGAAVVVVMTPWEEFATVSPEDLQDKAVIDAWGILAPQVGALRLGRLRTNASGGGYR